MNQQYVEKRAAAVIATIDAGVRVGTIPPDALTFADICQRASTPFDGMAALSEPDRSRVIRFVDEILRVRAGGVY